MDFENKGQNLLVNSFTKSVSQFINKNLLVNSLTKSASQFINKIC